MTLPGKADHWFFRYRVYHLPFWMAYHFLWWTVYNGSVWEVAQALTAGYALIKFLGYVIAQAIGVYFNLYFLIPRYLHRGQYGRYLPLLALTVCGTAVLTLGGYALGSALAGEPTGVLFNTEAPVYWNLLLKNTLPSAVASATLAMSIKLGKDYLRSRRRQQELEKQNLRMELSLLKSQLSPHFLFNSINSIFVLIHKNPDLAADTLARFSQLLRYQLHDSERRELPLAREIGYLDSFIDMARLRLDPRTNFECDLPESLPGNLVIAPGLLLPFIENAFKHLGPEASGDAYLRIHLSTVGNTLQLKVENSYTPDAPTRVLPENVSGVGLPNVRRRLALLYPGRHRLSVAPSGRSFVIRLQLTLGSAPHLPVGKQASVQAVAV